MNDQKWNDDEIERLLSKAPTIKDVRSKDEVLKKLQHEGYFKSERKKKMTIKHWLPAVVSLASILLLVILIPSLMSNQQTEMKSSADKSFERFNTAEKAEIAQDTSKEKAIATHESKSALTKKDSSVSKTAVYPADLENVMLFHLGLAGDAAESVPVTFLIPNSQISVDFPNRTPTTLELYEKYASQIDEEALGFTDYHPYKGSFQEEGEVITHILPKESGYDLASASLSMYQGSIQDTFSNYKEIRFKNENGTNYTFNEVGKEEGPMILKGLLKGYNFFLFTQGDGVAYLSPNNREKFSSVENALQAMKFKTNDIYDSVIPPNVDYTVKVNDSTVIVRFSKPLQLTELEPKKAMSLIEGILLTGASFDKAIQFENVVETNWEGFDLTKSLPKPVSPNVLPFVLK